jgi:hypothetical protein
VASQYSNDASSYLFEELCKDVLSPGAVGAMDQLRDEILLIYGLPEKCSPLSSFSAIKFTSVPYGLERRSFALSCWLPRSAIARFSTTW